MAKARRGVGRVDAAAARLRDFRTERRWIFSVGWMARSVDVVRLRGLDGLAG